MYRSCRLLLYPSKQEGFRLAGVEAASFGLPLLGLAGPVTEELFPPGTGDVIAKDLSRENIGEAAVPILRSGQLAAKLGRATSERLKDAFLKEHFARRLRQVLPQALFSCTSGADLKKRNSSVQATLPVSRQSSSK